MPSSDSSSPRPRVSVVVLCYGTARYVIEALESLELQSLQDYEVVIVDDASPGDDVRQLATWLSRRNLPAKLVVNQRNVGISAALNRGIRETSGEFVTWLSDDLWDPHRLELVLNTFDSLPPDVGVLFGEATVIDASGEPTGQTLSPPHTLAAVGRPYPELEAVRSGQVLMLSRSRVRPSLLARCFIPAPSATIRRSVHERLGGYDETLAVEDLDFWLRAAAVTNFAFLRASLVRYRRHHANFTGGRTPRYLEALDVTLRRHAATQAERSVIRRHIREEAYRVASEQYRAGHIVGLCHALHRHYWPNIDLSVRCAKESLRMAALTIRTLTRTSDP